MSRIIFFIFIISFFIFDVYSVEKSTSTWGMGGISIGRVKFDLSGIDNILTKYGYPGMPKKLSLIGAAGMGGINNLAFGGRGFGGVWTKGSVERSIKMSAGGGGFTPIYGLLKNEAYIGIVITIGGFGFDIKLTKKPNKYPSLEELIDEPSGDSTTHIYGGSFCLGLGITGFIKNDFSAIGFNCGKLYFSNFQWRSELGTEISEIEGPKSASYGFFDILFGGTEDSEEKQ